MRNIISLIYAGIILVFSAVGWQLFTFLDQNFAATRKQLEEAKEKITQLEIINQKLETANLFLKKTRRLAVISDVVKTKQEGSDKIQTSFSFTELDMANKPIGKKREFTIDGDIVYVDMKVIKFEDRFIEEGDALKGCSLCLFNRIFSEKQSPEDGFPIDEGITPKPYKLDSPDSSKFEQELWKDFWKLAQTPAEAEKKGVRAAHGSAPSMKLEEGATYKLEMRTTGELTFKRE